MNPYLLGFRCLTCGALHAPESVTYACPTDGGNLDAVYDYARIAREVAPAALAGARDRSIWRYEPLLPAKIETHTPTPLSALGWSPLYRAPRLEQALDVRAIWLKDDSRLPSSSFRSAALRTPSSATARGDSTDR